MKGTCLAPREEGEGGRTGRMGRGGGHVMDIKEKEGFCNVFTGLRRFLTAAVVSRALALFHARMDDDDSNTPS
jgi:hypothetical protein